MSIGIAFLIGAFVLAAVLGGCLAVIAGKDSPKDF